MVCVNFFVYCIEYEDNRNIGIEVAEVEKDHWSASDESMHEFKVCIKCEDLARIMEHSKANKEVSKIFSQFVAYIFFIRDFGFIQFLKKRVVFLIVFSHCFLIIENVFI